MSIEVNSVKIIGSDKLSATINAGHLMKDSYECFFFVKEYNETTKVILTLQDDYTYSVTLKEGYNDIDWKNSNPITAILYSHQTGDLVDLNNNDYFIYAKTQINFDYPGTFDNIDPVLGHIEDVKVDFMYNIKSLVRDISITTTNLKHILRVDNAEEGLYSYLDDRAEIKCIYNSNDIEQYRIAFEIIGLPGEELDNSSKINIDINNGVLYQAERINNTIFTVIRESAGGFTTSAIKNHGAFKNGKVARIMYNNTLIPFKYNAK